MTTDVMNSQHNLVLTPTTLCQLIKKSCTCMNVYFKKKQNDLVIQRKITEYFELIIIELSFVRFMCDT